MPAVWRGETDDVCEVEVQSQQTPLLTDTGFEDQFVRRATQYFLKDSCDIVPRRREKVRRSRTEVLVELELHAALLPGKSTYRSRLISAP